MTSARFLRSKLVLASLLVACVVESVSDAKTPPATTSLGRHTGIAPEDTILAQAARARASDDEAQALAAMAVIASLADQAPDGVARSAIDDVARSLPVRSELAGEAAALARSLAADDGAQDGSSNAGIVTELSVLGPFRDTGGGLDAHDGPEASKTAEGFVDGGARYAWGAIDVRWRPIPRAYAKARGLPLDLFVHPRKESCSWVATKVTVGRATPLVVRLAAAGTARLTFDGVDAAKSEDVHAGLRFDRLAAKVNASPGAHILAAKVCAGALADSGRVRLRITGEANEPVDVRSSSELALRPGESIPWGTAKPTALVTSLMRVASQTGSVDALLAAATLRTLGGADDAKSPRAPGLLDAVLQTKGLDADRLAMAAWITPSDAHKSSRLYRARTAAESSGDNTTKSFVERRLVEQHLATGAPDWAMATMRGAALDTASDPEARRLSAAVARALRVDTLAIRAMRELAASYRSNPARASTALLRELAALARSSEPKTWLDVALELSRRGQKSDAVGARAALGKDAVESAALEAFDGGLEDADDALGIARHVVEAGSTEVATKLYSRLVEWAPNRPESWAGLARALATKRSDDRDLLAALVRARELSPGDSKYRAELDMRLARASEGASGGRGAGFSDDERYLASSEAILARRKGAPPLGRGQAPDVADRELHWLRAVRMHADGRVSQLIHYAREVVIAPRSQQELFELIPPEGDLTEILRARVHRKDGSLAFPVEEHNDGLRPRIRWPDLDPGDTVEVAIRQWTRTAVGGRGDAPFYFLDYAGAPASHPLLYNEVVIETVPGHPLHVDVLNEKLAPYTRTERDDPERGVHVLRLVWEKPLVVPEEPLAPETTEVAPVIVGSTFRSWAEFRAWYAEAVRGFTEPDAEVRRLADELTRGKRTRDDKLRAIFEFVADDIRYVNFVSGESWLPNRPHQLLARREGDCDDKAMLLITLLKAIGIEAQEVMVQTRLKGQPSVLLAKTAAVPMFDHGIAFLPGPNGGTYLDATSPMSRLGPLPSMDARAVALRMDSGPPEIISLPLSSPSDHGADVTWRIGLAADGSGDLEGEEMHTGDAAFWLRTNLAEPDARPQYVEDALVAPWFSTVELDKRIDFRGDQPGGRAVVRYKARSRGMARREGRDLVLPLSPAATFTSELAPLPTRTLPVVLPPSLAPSHFRRTIRAVAPAKMTWGEFPPGVEANGGDFGSAHLELSRDPRDPRTLIIKRSVVFNLHVIPVQEYDAWRRWLRQVDTLLHKEVRLVEAK